MYVYAGVIIRRSYHTYNTSSSSEAHFLPLSPLSQISVNPTVAKRKQLLKARTNERTDIFFVAKLQQDHMTNNFSM